MKDAEDFQAVVVGRRQIPKMQRHDSIFTFLKDMQLKDGQAIRMVVPVLQARNLAQFWHGIASAKGKPHCRFFLQTETTYVVYLWVDK